MQTKSKGMKVWYLLFGALCVVLLGVAAVWDLKIDQMINNPENYFGEFLARIGELPVYLVAPFSAVVFFAANKKTVWKAVLSALLAVLGWVLFFVWFGGNWFKSDDFRDAFSVVLAVFVSAVSLFIAAKLPEKTMKQLQPFAVFLLIAAIGTALSVEGIKRVWGRVRFRDLLRAEDFSAFTPWYLPQGVTGNKSFPSGHTSAASASLLLSALPCVFEKFKKQEVKIFIITALYTFAVGLSRMIVGAHYLSDITMGTLIGFLWMVAIKKLYLEKRLAK
ncbi:MAG: phosphatase PAP2 family protein [Oscillospiraceae bacterium]|jgi:membrane-associated phospholipid phosphatase|nr:phosphatase PAP2 family protein [Oscillospiraceae bacterium]